MDLIKKRKEITINQEKEMHGEEGSRALELFAYLIDSERMYLDGSTPIYQFIFSAE